MQPQELRSLAQTGDAPAIAALIAQGLHPLGIESSARREGSGLWIALSAEWAIPQSIVIRILQRTLRRVAPQGIEWVEVQAESDNGAGWRCGWELGSGDHLPPFPEGAGRALEIHPARSRPDRSSRPVRSVRNDDQGPAAPVFRHPRLAGVGALLSLLLGIGGLTLWDRPQPPLQPPREEPRIAGRIERPPPKPAAPPNLAPGPIRIKAVGDIVPGTDYPAPRLMAGREEEVFERVRALMADADLAFGNLETTLTNHPACGKDISQPNVYAFRTPPDYAQWLRQAGFDLLNVANNHSFDFQAQGFADTLRHLEAAGIQGVGERGRPAIRTLRGRRIAFIGFSYLSHTDSIHDPQTVAALMEQARGAADLVVVSVHAGAEGSDALHLRDAQEYYLGERRGNLVAFAHAVIDQGADLVLGHGPHVPRAMELYKGRLIAYSLGNFMGYRTLSTAGAGGVSLVLDVELDRDGAFRGGRIHPVRLDGSGLPFADPGGEAVKLVRELTLADLPKSGVAVDDKGALNAGRDEEGVLAARDARGTANGPMVEARAQATEAAAARELVR